MQWETVIGLEVHVQLATESKLFSPSACAYGAEPNTQASAIDLGLPGVLPVFNEAALALAIKFGLSINAKIAHRSIFARKNYFYPDLPKGYQISQLDLPIVSGGTLAIRLPNGSTKTIGITRAHLEEDAGKCLHEGLEGISGVDLNRAGIPLIEIVSEPDIRSPVEAVAYLKTLHSLVRYLEISDANMQEGSFRCDANISLRPKGTKKFGTRTEIKNLNSFRFIERALMFEIQRQQDVLENGGTVIQETRLYDSAKDETRAMRGKEEAHDYRYFSDPDLLPVIIEDSYVESIKQQLPELPWQKYDRFKKEYQLSDYDALLLSHEKETAQYFESTIKAAKATPAKIVANWIIGDLTAALNKNNLQMSNSLISPDHLGQLLSRITDGSITNHMAKKVFHLMWGSGDAPDTIIEKQGLKQITDTSALEAIIDEVIQNNPNQVAQYRTGKDKLWGYFIGQVMKATHGKANPKQINEILKRKLNK
jgi:aspartyl-tRNA(Asn)/glutamyl-tRNA(Gln) amidotransferase subunit B